jgi:hypothetical protein
VVGWAEGFYAIRRQTLNIFDLQLVNAAAVQKVHDFFATGFDATGFDFFQGKFSISDAIFTT